MSIISTQMISHFVLSYSIDVVPTLSFYIYSIYQSRVTAFIEYENIYIRIIYLCIFNPLRWRHNGHDSVSNHQPHDCLLNRLFRRRSKKTSKLRVTGLCVGNSPGSDDFPAQMASNAENASILWRHHASSFYYGCSSTLVIIPWPLFT